MNIDLDRKELPIARAAIATVFAGFRLPAETTRAGNALVYTHNETAHGVRLGLYSGRPVWRFHVNTNIYAYPSRAMLKRLGCHNSYVGHMIGGLRCGYELEPRLEFSVHEDELQTVAAWLPSWIDAAHAGAPLPAAPVSTTTPDVHSYVWTTAGDAAIRKLNAERDARFARRRAR